jgi:hypothetical protein
MVMVMMTMVMALPAVAQDDEDAAMRRISIEMTRQEEARLALEEENERLRRELEAAKMVEAAQPAPVQAAAQPAPSSGGGSTALQILCGQNPDHPLCGQDGETRPAPAAPQAQPAPAAPQAQPAPAAPQVDPRLARAQRLVAEYDLQRMRQAEQVGMDPSIKMFDLLAQELCGGYATGRTERDRLAEMQLLGTSVYACTGGSRPADWNEDKMTSVRYHNGQRAGNRDATDIVLFVDGAMVPMATPQGPLKQWVLWNEEMQEVYYIPKGEFAYLDLSYGDHRYQAYKVVDGRVVSVATGTISATGSGHEMFPYRWDFNDL